MKTIAVALLTVSLALAGCFGGGGDDDPDPSPTGTGTGTPTASPSPTPRDPVTQVLLLQDFDFQGCSGTAILHPAPIEDVQALLPDGFEAGAISQVPGNEGLLAVELYACDTFTTPSVTFEDVWFGQAYTLVHPPTERYPERDLDADYHEYTFQILAGDSVLAQVWPVAGYDSYNGTASHNITSAVLAAQSATSTGDYVLNGQGPATELSTFDGTFIRYTVLEGGDTLMWSGTRDTPAAYEGAGTATVPSGSPFSGQGTVQGDLLQGQSRIVTDGAFTDETLIRVFAEPR